jgi:hypothetical protein
MQTPSLGRIVLARTDPTTNNGADVCPALITRVWGPAAAGGHEWVTVNLKLFRDGNNDVASVTSARLFADEPAAASWAAEQDPPVVGGEPGVAYWPPRV